MKKLGRVFFWSVIFIFSKQSIDASFPVAPRLPFPGEGQSILKQYYVPGQQCKVTEYQQISLSDFERYSESYHGSYGRYIQSVLLVLERSAQTIDIESIARPEGIMIAQSLITKQEFENSTICHYQPQPTSIEFLREQVERYAQREDSYRAALKSGGLR